MSYSDVKAINPCLKAACQDVCGMEVGMTVWPADVCSADAPGSTGTAGSGGGGTGGAGGSSGAGGTGGTHPPPKHGGCDVAGSAGAPSAVALLLLLVIAAALRGRRRAYAHMRIRLK